MPIELQYGAPTPRAALNIRFAIDRGDFRREGIDLSIKVVYGGPEIAYEYDQGLLKIGEFGSPPAVTALARGKRFRIIGSGMSRRAGMFFLVHKDIAGWQDLKGTTVGALSIGSCSYWYLRDLLRQHGLDPDEDVRILGLGDRTRISLDLFASGEISALLTSSVNGTAGEAAGLLRIWGDVLSLADVPELQWAVQVANQDFLQTERDLAATIRGIGIEAAGHLRDHRDEWVAYSARHFGVTPEVARRAIEIDLPFIGFDGRIDLAGLQNAFSLQQKLGAIPEAISARSVLDPLAQTLDEPAPAAA